MRDVVEVAHRLAASPFDNPVTDLARAFLVLLAEYERERAARRRLSAVLLARACHLEALREGPEELLLELIAARLRMQAAARSV